MYTTGDCIVYPMHGAGIVRAIEEKEIFGKIQQYYIVDILSEQMEILIPVDKATKIGIRNVMEKDELERELKQLNVKGTVQEKNWNQRVHEMMERLKTGKLSDAGKVLGSLTRKERRQGLSASEKKMLMTARNFFASEMVMIDKITKEEALKRIDEAIL